MPHDSTGWFFNTISNNSFSSTISRERENIIHSGSEFATVGGGVFGNRVATNTTIAMGLSAVITGLAPGNYQVGLAGASSDAANWNSNEYIYTAAAVY